MIRVDREQHLTDAHARRCFRESIRDLDVSVRPLASQDARVRIAKGIRCNCVPAAVNATDQGRHLLLRVGCFPLTPNHWFIDIGKALRDAAINHPSLIACAVCKRNPLDEPAVSRLLIDRQRHERRAVGDNAGRDVNAQPFSDLFGC